MKIKLVSPSTQFEDSFIKSLNSINEKSEKLAWIYLGDSADIEYPINHFNKYVEMLKQRQTVPPVGFVCDTTYWAIIGNEVVGRISIRHELNEFLSKVGGHIGYITHPHWRKQGIASQMLCEILKTEKAKDIGRLLLTCDEHNIASIKTILKNGGKADGIYDVGNHRPKKSHFWIEL